MDIDALGEALRLGTTAFGAVKDLIAQLPNSAEREAARKQLQQAEIAFGIAEANAAKALHYEICRKHWPPIVGLATGKYRNTGYGNTRPFKCPDCGQTLPPKWPAAPPLEDLRPERI